MKTTIGTRFRCGCPLSDLNKLTIMFETLELQYLNKLVKGEIGDFASPEAFHTLKVQCLSGNRIKPTTQVGRTFVVPISALIGDLAVKSCEFTNSTPPIARSFLFSTHCLVEFTELVQGLFQGVRMVDLLTGAECQIGVHTEVYPYAFTCSGQYFFGGIICNNVEPQCSDSIPTDLNVAEVPVPFTMVVEREITFIIFVELLGFRIPLPERDADTPPFKLICRLKLRRTVFATLFELRGTDTSATSTVFDPIEEPLIPDMDTDNYSVKCITRYPYPVFMSALEQLRQMRLQPIPPGVFPIDAVIPLLQSKEVVMDIAKVIKHVAQTFILWMLAYLIFVGPAILFLFSFFHRNIKYQVFNP